MSEIFSSEIVLIGDDESANVGSDDSRNAQVGGISSSDDSAEGQLKKDDLEKHVIDVVLHLKQLEKICTTESYLDDVNELLNMFGKWEDFLYGTDLHTFPEA